MEIDSLLLAETKVFDETQFYCNYRELEWQKLQTSRNVLTISLKGVLASFHHE